LKRDRIQGKVKKEKVAPMRRTARFLVVALVALGLAVVPALAGPKGVKGTQVSGPAVKFTGDPGSITFGRLNTWWTPISPRGKTTAATTLSQVPNYLWYHGCSPTAGGMLIGYWALHGYPQLMPGVSNPMVPGSQTPPSKVYKIISSPEHNVNDTYEGHAPNCLADFMKTVNGGTYIQDIPTGLKDWSTSVGVTTAAASHSYVKLWGGSFSYAKYQAEITAGRPMLLNLMTYTTDYGWLGHSVLAYGFQANMFTLQITTGRRTLTVTVPGFAVMDTWGNATGAASLQASWLGWNGQPVYPIAQGGYVWWPFLDMTQTKGYSFSNLWDWQVMNGVFYNPAGMSAGAGATPTARIRRTFPEEEAGISPRYRTITFTSRNNAAAAPYQRVLQGLQEHARINVWSGGEGSGVEAVTSLLSFR
jgi:hypothetical protein